MTDSERPTPPLFDADEARDLQALGISGASAPRRAGCPDPALVLALDEGVLDEGVAARVRAHVISCPACQTAAADLARVFDGEIPADSRARIDARLAAVRPRPARRLWYWLVPAGGLALATAGLLWALGLRPDAPALPDARIAQVTPPALPTVFVVDRPAIPPGEIDLAVRGDAATRADLANQVALALDRADAGDVKGAVVELDDFVRRNPESKKAGVALGALQLREDRNAEAAATLERARRLATDPDMNDEVDWFLAIARVRTGDRDGARALLDALCRRTGARGARACAGLAEIDRLPSSR
jgi:hypothetical protein